MMTSTMKNNPLIGILSKVAVFAFWMLIWYLLALWVNNPLFLPTPTQAFGSLFELLQKPEFYKVIACSFLRVLAGILLGIALGLSLAIICNKSSIIEKLLSPFFSVIKATPVATFIVLLWILLNGSALAIIIAVLMVMPIIWQNTLDGFGAIPRELIEVTDIFELPYRKKFRILILPVLKKYIFPAIITSIGLGWKAEIAAEIIAYTKDSIGMYINDAKSFMQTSNVYAWTIVIICMSVLLENGAKFLIRRLNK